MDATRRHAQHVGRNLRRIRKLAGLTQEQLGDALNVDQRKISRWENGHHAPSADSLEQLAAALDVRWTDFYRA